MKQIIIYFMNKIKKDNIGAYAGQASLFFIMSMIPFLLILLSLIRYTPVSETFLIQTIDTFIPGVIAPWITSIISEVYHNTGGILIISIVLSVYSAAKTIQSLRYALNFVYDIKETRNWFVLRLRAMAETLALILLILSLMLLLMFGKKIQSILVIYLPFAAVVTGYILKLRLLILFVALIVVFTVTYKLLPNRKATFKSQLVGAVGCSVAWYVFSFFVSIYINYFHGFSLYGSLTTVVLIMFWLYFAMYIFLVCGEVNNAFEMIVLELKMERARKKMQAEKGEMDEMLAAQMELKEVNEEIDQE